MNTTDAPPTLRTLHSEFWILLVGASHLPETWNLERETHWSKTSG